MIEYIHKLAEDLMDAIDDWEQDLSGHGGDYKDILIRHLIKAYNQGHKENK